MRSPPNSNKHYFCNWSWWAREYSGTSHSRGNDQGVIVSASAIKEIKLVAFDVAGTTVNDDGLVIKAFKVAFEKSQPELWPEKGEH